MSVSKKSQVKKVPSPEEIKKIFPNARDIISYAFTLNGIAYFEFDDFNNVPCERGFHCLSFYNEMAMRCSHAYLLAHTEAKEKLKKQIREFFIVKDGKLDLNGCLKKIDEDERLDLQLKERLQWITEVEIAYKLCTVVFFDATENPYRYDYKKGLEKAQIFKDTPIEDFFLLRPITKLLPSTNLSISDLRDYLVTMTAMNRLHLDNISMTLSEMDKKRDWSEELQSLVKSDVPSTISKT